MGGNLFGTLKSMQEKTKIVYLVDGQIKKTKDMNNQEKKGADRVILPYYPKLQGVDFDMDCYDTLEIYNKLIDVYKRQP